jgi:hypothetical protein
MHEEAGRRRKLVQPARLSLPHPVVCLWIWSTVLLQLGQEGAFYADRPHDIGADNNGEDEQASAVPHIVRRGMKEGVIGSSRTNKHKVLAVALAQKEPLWKWPGIHLLNAFQCLVAYATPPNKLISPMPLCAF